MQLIFYFDLVSNELATFICISDNLLNNLQFYFYFPFNTSPFYFFLLPYWTSSIMMNRDSKSRHSFLISNLKEKVSLIIKYCAYCIISFISLTYKIFIRDRC